MIRTLPQHYGRQARNRLSEAKQPNIEGACALIESFYYAFNQRDMTVFAEIWAQDELIQLNNPLGGILRGYEAIAALYQRIFTGPAHVWVELYDIVLMQSEMMVVFAGRERGEFSHANTTVPLNIRTSRVVQWCGEAIGWKQVHHHGSIDDATALLAYQQAVVFS